MLAKIYAWKDFYSKYPVLASAKKDFLTDANTGYLL